MHKSFLTRRRFLRRAALLLPGPALAASAAGRILGAENKPDKPKVRVGLVTDPRYADKAP